MSAALWTTAERVAQNLHNAGDGCLFRYPSVEADDTREHRNFAASLPKTGSGKTRRRPLKSVTHDREPGDISAIEDEGPAPGAHVAGHAVRQARCGHGERRRKRKKRR